MTVPERVVDAHHHLWDLEANSYPWLARGGPHPMFGDDYENLRRDYLISEFLADIGDLPIHRSVHLQADHDPSDPVRESLWLDAVAEGPGSRGFPHAIVGYVDFFDDGAARVLDDHAAIRRVVGVRQTLHHRAGDPLNNPTWLANFEGVARHGFSYDLQVYPRQADPALALVDRHRQTQFILVHSGLPQDRSPEGIDPWRAAMRRFAERDNLVCKLSGFGMLNRSWRVDDIRPIVTDLIDIFGPQRLLCGSNYPVDRFAGAYARLWNALFEITGGLSADERDAMFWGVATRVYRLDDTRN